MEDTLITFKTAKLAKEKGFNEREHWFYKVKSENDIELYGCTKKELVGFKGYNPIYYKVNDYHTNKEKYNAKLYRCSAPTQSLLQKWLREKYNIDIIIDTTRVIKGEKNKGEYAAIIYSNNKVLFHWDLGGLHQKYEEALEVALQEALNLIDSDLVIDNEG